MYGENPLIVDLRKEHKKIFSFLEQSRQGKILDLREALKGSNCFFEMLKVVLEKGSEEEKRVANQLFQELLFVFAEEMRKTMD